MSDVGFFVKPNSEFRRKPETSNCLRIRASDIPNPKFGSTERGFPNLDLLKLYNFEYGTAADNYEL